MRLVEFIKNKYIPENDREHARNLATEIKPLVYEYKEVAIKLKSGKVSHHYFDFRKLILQPDSNPLKMRMKNLFGRLIQRNSDKLDNLTFAGAGGTVLGADMRNFLNIPGIVDRQIPKTHGKKELLVGDYFEGMNTSVPDDVFTSGTSSKVSITNVMSETGKNPDAVFVLLNRSKLVFVPGTEIPIYSLFTMEDFGFESEE